MNIYTTAVIPASGTSFASAFRWMLLFAALAFLPIQLHATPNFSWGLQANGGLLIVASNPDPVSASCAASWDVNGEEFGDTKTKHFYNQFFVPAKRENFNVLVGGGADFVNPRLAGDPSIACSGAASAGGANAPRRTPKPVSAPAVSRPPAASSPAPSLPGASSPANRPRGVFVAGVPDLPNADGTIPVQTWIVSCSSAWNGACSSNPDEIVAVAPHGWEFCTAGLSTTGNGKIVERYLDPDSIGVWVEARGSNDPFNQVGGSIKAELDPSGLSLIFAGAGEGSRKEAGCTIPAKNQPAPQTPCPPPGPGVGPCIR
jgi:hypothetical protein